MQLKLLLETLDRLDEGLFKKVQAAVELEPDPGRRAMILAKMARDNNLPGLYDPVDGTYYNINGEQERSPDNAVTAQLGKFGLVPPNAKTSMFGLWGADDVKAGAISQSAGLNTADERDEKIARLNDLIKKVSRGLKESRSISDVLYESFFGLNEEGPPVPGDDAEYSAYSLRPLDRDIEEMKKLMAELGALNKEVPNSNIDSVLERAQEVIDRASKKPEPPKPPVTPPAPPPSVSPVTPAPPPPSPVGPVTPPAPAPTPAVDPRLEKIKKARELFDKVKSTPMPGPISPQINPNQPPKPDENKKWPTTPDEIKAFQKGRDDPRQPGEKLVVDGLIGTHTLQALVDAGYKPPNDFTATAYKPKRNNNRPVAPQVTPNKPELAQVDINAQIEKDKNNPQNKPREPFVPNPTGLDGEGGDRPKPDTYVGNNPDYHGDVNPSSGGGQPAMPPPTGPNGEPMVRNPRTGQMGYMSRQGRGQTFVPISETTQDDKILSQIKNVRF